MIAMACATVVICGADAPGKAPAADSASASVIVEVAGTAEIARSGGTNWVAAEVGSELNPGDRLRTREASRAAIRFSERSVIRLGERTTLEVQPPKGRGERRLGLWKGLLYFFNRERPESVEFETPVAAGAIRGTEFVLESRGTEGDTELALIDGAVQLEASGREVTMGSGEMVRVRPGEAPVKTALLEAVRVVQWAMYYPAVLNPADLALSEEQRARLATALTHYRAGDVLAARRAFDPSGELGSSMRILAAALDLSVGQVEAAREQLSELEAGNPLKRALLELMDAASGAALDLAPLSAVSTASEWLARSYSFQAQFRLRDALAAAHRAVELAPEFGFAHARVGELEWSLEHRREAMEALEHALQAAPRLAPAYVSRGFILLEQDEPRAALRAFQQALGIDSALGTAWLGQGLASLRLRQREEALRSLQMACALEPRRSLFRSYLGKAWSLQREPQLAEKEFRLAKTLDPNDPTPWLYEALHLWILNRPNAAVRELEHSVDRNDHLRLFRSRLLLDRDLAVRTANLAVLYRDAGLEEVSLRSAAQAVNEDYTSFSSHLFLANSIQTLENPNRFDLRYETSRASEFLLANLLAPAEAGNLSHLPSHQENLRLFDPPRVALDTLTEYSSSGSWLQQSSIHGTVEKASYAVDSSYESFHGTSPNEWRERWDLSLQFKERVTRQDDLFFQASTMDMSSGDTARHYDPQQSNPGLLAKEQQVPNLYAGWHHTWSPSSHTIFLAARVDDTFELHNPEPALLFLYQREGQTASVSTPPFFNLDSSSHFTLYSAEAQQIWQGDHHALIVGGRAQSGGQDAEAILRRALGAEIPNQRFEESLERADAYTYFHWQPLQPIRLVAGVSYSWLSYPQNLDLAPFTPGTRTVDLFAPKAGLLVTPWRDGLFRASYTESLGGVYFDNSVRLEPTQIAGFNQAYRSLISESVAGLVPGARMETVSVAFDQSWRSRTYLGIQAERLFSRGDRTAGVLTNSLPLPIPNLPSSTAQTLDYREDRLSLYCVQLLGDGVSVGARYGLTDSDLETRFPQIPRSARGVEVLEVNNQALLHQVHLTLAYQHPAGFFAGFQSSWYRQSNQGYSPALPGDDFWQHDLWTGWRFPRRQAELRLDLLNLTGTDYRLNPLNPYLAPSRQRTLAVSFRIHF
jgi:hypothetical protein